MKKHKGSSLLRVSACLVVVFFILTGSVLARDWSGRLIDAITGEPVVGARVEMGVPGLISKTSETDESGYFALSWNPNQWRDDYKEHNLRFIVSGYRRMVVSRSRPEENLVVKILPDHVYVEGQVINAKTGQAVPDLTLRLGTPGLIVGNAVTDSEGRFIFKGARLYKETDNIHEYPASLGVDYNRDPGPVQPYQIRIDNNNYDNNTYVIPTEFLIPSLDGQVRVFVHLQAQLKGDSEPRVPSWTEVIGLTNWAESGDGNCAQLRMNLQTLVIELQSMIERADTNQAAHPNFITDLYRWLDELESELVEETAPTWGEY